MLMQSGIKKFRHGLISATALARGLAVIVPLTVASQAAAQTAPIATYDIPAQDLTGALRQFAEASHLQLVDEANITDGKTSPGVVGRFTADEAARRLLAGTGLTFQIASGAIVVTAGVKRAGVALGNVVVQGANQMNGATAVNGINGSHDVEATEGTGSYTSGALSIASKAPLSIRETPQSVSVLTSQQIADQNLTSVRQGLEQMPGLTVVTAGGGNLNYDIFSRGFLITSFEIDGGAPLTERQSYVPLINLALYDSVQLIRGSDGLMNGYGDPGGVVNLVRKKPLDHNQLTYEQDAGSYHDFREVADITGPIAFGGHLRARAVVSEEDKGFFYKVAQEHDFLAYGILEADLGSRTTVSVGGSYTRGIAIPSNGLPRYDSGASLNLPLSTFLGSANSRYYADTAEVFAIVEHRFSTDWFTKLNVGYNDQSMRTEIAAASGQIGLNSGVGAAVQSAAVNYFPNRQLSVDYNLNGGIHIFGRKQAITVGASYSHDNGDFSSLENTTFLNGKSSINADVFNFNPYLPDYNQTTVPGGSYFPILRTDQYGIYANIRLAPFKGFHFSIGERFSGFVTQSSSILNLNLGSSILVIPVPSASTRDHTFSQPNLGATYDLPAGFTVYGSYESTYRAQSGPTSTVNGTLVALVVPPVTGVNKEVGLKWESPSKRFNSSLAFYYIKENNILTINSILPVNQSYNLDDRVSKGIDFQAAGQLATGWQISTSYAYNENRRTTVDPKLNVATDGLLTLASVQPRHIFKLLSTYHFHTDNWLKRFTIGGSMYYQSDAFYSGTVCRAYSTTAPFGCTAPLDPTDPTGKRKLSTTIPFDFVTKGYATFNGQVQYQLNPHLDLTLTVNNLTNVKTYQTSVTETTSIGNFYLPPANFLVAIKAKW